MSPRWRAITAASWDRTPGPLTVRISTPMVPAMGQRVCHALAGGGSGREAGAETHGRERAAGVDRDLVRRVQGEIDRGLGVPDGNGRADVLAEAVLQLAAHVEAGLALAGPGDRHRSHGDRVVGIALGVYGHAEDVGLH